MDLNKWGKLTARQQKKIVKNWNIQKDEGQDMALTILKAFIRQYGSNKNIEIEPEIIRLRDNVGWTIGVQCLNESGLKIIPLIPVPVLLGTGMIENCTKGRFKR